MDKTRETLTQNQRGEALRRLLDEIAPGDWLEEREEPGSDRPRDDPSISFTRSSDRPYGRLALEVVIRHDGDVDVVFRVPGHSPELHERHFLVATGGELDALEEVAQVAGDFNAERMVLGRSRGLFGGTVFVPAAEATPERLRKLAWAVSWHGSYDHPRAETPA